MVARFLLRLITDSHNLHYGIYSYNITVCALGYGEGAATTAADDALKIVARGTVKRTARQPMIEKAGTGRLRARLVRGDVCQGLHPRLLYPRRLLPSSLFLVPCPLPLAPCPFGDAADPQARARDARTGPPATSISQIWPFDGLSLWS